MAGRLDATALDKVANFSEGAASRFVGWLSIVCGGLVAAGCVVNSVVAASDIVAKVGVLAVVSDVKDVMRCETFGLGSMGAFFRLSWCSWLSIGVRLERRDAARSLSGVGDFDLDDDVGWVDWIMG